MVFYVAKVELKQSFYDIHNALATLLFFSIQSHFMKIFKCMLVGFIHENCICSNTLRINT